MSDENTLDEAEGSPDDGLISNVDVPVAAAFEQATSEAATVAASVMEPATSIGSDESDGFSFNAVPNMSVTVDNPVTKRQKLNPNVPYIAALKMDIDELESILQARGLVDLDDSAIEKLSNSDRRLVSLSRSLTQIWQDVYFDDIDKTGNWHQAVQHDTSRLGIGRFKVETMSDPIMAIRATFGQGTVIQVPLWNTGIWISVKAPTVQELLDFDQRARLEKMNLGRSTNGMVFSNVEVYTVELYMRFVLEHVISTTYKLETSDAVEELLGVIRNRDYQQMCLGLVTAMYPDGYPFRQPCVANTDKCEHMDELLLNFARMGFTDRDKITEKQARMMANRKDKKTALQLAEYQADFTFFEERVDLGRGLVAVLAVPSLADQIDAGHMWVDGISKATSNAFGARLSDMERVRHIMRSGAISGLRQHSHWIKQFEHTTDPDSQPRIIEDLQNKDRMLDMLTEDPEISLALTKRIIEWVRKTTVSYVGLPKSACPSCQQEPEDQSHPHLIPIDIGYVFFTLAVLKISLVEGAAV
jgi:hypothetical protein